MANRYFSSKKTGPKKTFSLLKAKRIGILEKLNEMDFSKKEALEETVLQFENQGLKVIAENLENVFKGK
jgi:hypothetical protein